MYDGATRTEAAKIGGVGLQIIRDWVLRFNGRGPKGLLDGKSPGQPSKLNDPQRQAIAQMIESGPIPAVHGVVRWRLVAKIVARGAHAMLLVDQAGWHMGTSKNSSRQVLANLTR